MPFEGIIDEGLGEGVDARHSSDAVVAIGGSHRIGEFRLGIH